MEKMPENLFDDLIDEALRQPPETGVPDHFADRVVSAAAQQGTARDSLIEFFYKCLIAFSAFAVFSIVFYLVSIKSKEPVIAYVEQNWVFIGSILVIGLFVLFADQVFLRYLFNRYRYLSRN